MKRLFLLAGILAIAGCESAPKDVPPKEALFVTDDCALITAIGRERYDLSRDDPPMTVKLNGEDAPWTPSCDWQAAGFNLVEVRGPEGEAATASMNRLTFNRPRYDSRGALIRTSLTAAGQTTVVLCRVEHAASGWSLDSCGPDPKLTQPRETAPTPADQTPDSKIAAPLTGERAPTARDLGQSQADPGAPPGSPNN
jgi:hypothetical protein